MLYCVRKTGKAHWAGDRKQTTLWQISSRDQDAETVHRSGPETMDDDGGIGAKTRDGTNQTHHIAACWVRTALRMAIHSLSRNGERGGPVPKCHDRMS